MVRVLTVNAVRLSLQKSNPPTILVEADGIVGTPGWKNLDLVAVEDPVSADGILDLEFVGTPPTGIVIQTPRPVTADFVITKDVEKIVGVVVHSRTNSVTQLLSVATNPGGPSGGVAEFGRAGFSPFPDGPVGPNVLGIPDIPGIPDNWPPKLPFPWGEGRPPKFPPDDIVKTWAIGEEGKSFFRPEEGKTWLNWEEGIFPGQFGETPPLPWRVEILADPVKQPISEGTLGTTNPASDTAMANAMFGMPFGTR